jgi:YjbE family integral membrane protein
MNTALRMDQIYQLGFWAAVVKIIWINILLSGDNAIVIALACRRLPQPQRRWGMIIGAGVASALLILFTGIVTTLMTLPYLKLVGGCVLLWIAFRLLVADSEEHVEAVDDLWRAVRIVVVADVVMSLDNVIAVAAAAGGSYLLLGLGLTVSIPIVIGGAALITALLESFPILVWAGAALLGWIVGEVIATDPVVQGFLEPRFGAEGFHYIVLFCALVGAILVLVVGGLWRRSKQAAHAEKVRAAAE